MAYIGKIKDRITVTAEIVKTHDYTKKFSYATNYYTIYIMKTTDGDELVWNTSGFMAKMIEGEDHPQSHGVIKDGKEYGYIYAHEGDIVNITGTVSEHSEYNGREQTVLQRVKLNDIVGHNMTWAERQELRKAEEKAKEDELRASLGEGDQIIRMAYGRYKEHYADCEVLKSSYKEDRRGNKTIEVIVRANRMKASGVRGEHFYHYLLKNTNGSETCWFKAVSLENAIRQAEKRFPNTKWVKVESKEFIEMFSK